MTTLQTGWRRCMAALGTSGIAGVALALAAVLFFGTAVQEREADLARLRQQADTLATRTAVPAAAAQAVTPEQQLVAFAEYFPPVSTLQDWIERVHAVGAATGIDVQRTDYRVAPGPVAGLTRYDITIPVRGSYTQIRVLVAGLLEAVPSLALVDIDLKREAIGAAAVEARLDLALFLRGGVK